MLFKELKEVIPQYKYKGNFGPYGPGDLTKVIYITIDGEYTYYDRNDPILNDYKVKEIAMASASKRPLLHIDLTKGE